MRLRTCALHVFGGTERTGFLSAFAVCRGARRAPTEIRHRGSMRLAGTPPTYAGSTGSAMRPFYLKSKYGGLRISDAARLRALEDENRRLKKLLPESISDRPPPIPRYGHLPGNGISYTVSGFACRNHGVRQQEGLLCLPRLRMRSAQDHY